MYATLDNTTDTFEAVTDLIDEVIAHRAIVVVVVVLVGCRPGGSYG